MWPRQTQTPKFVSTNERSAAVIHQPIGNQQSGGRTCRFGRKEGQLLSQLILCWVSKLEHKGAITIPMGGIILFISKKNRLSYIVSILTLSNQLTFKNYPNRLKFLLKNEIFCDPTG